MTLLYIHWAKIMDVAIVCSGVETDVNVSFANKILFWLFSYDAYVALTLLALGTWTY